jgi:hypothetical protein
MACSETALPLLGFEGLKEFHIFRAISTMTRKLFRLSFHTKRRGVAFITLASLLGGPGFTSQLGDWPY